MIYIWNSIADNQVSIYSYACLYDCSFIFFQGFMKIIGLRLKIYYLEFELKFYLVAGSNKPVLVLHFSTWLCLTQVAPPGNDRGPKTSISFKYLRPPPFRVFFSYLSVLFIISPVSSLILALTIL